MAGAAIREITEQLRTPGNPGHVWIQDWGRRYQSVLGPLRGFLEGNPDHFMVTQEGGNRFSVALVKGSGWKRSPSTGKGGGGGGSWGGKGWGKGSWGGGAQMAIGNGGWDPVVAAAIREIKEQLLAPGSDGTVWVEKWGPRFQDYLGPLRAFMESRPDKFNIVPGEGRKYTVEYVGGGTATGATPVPRKRSAGEGSQSPNAKRQKKEPEPDVKINPEDLTEMALEEVTKMLQKPGNKGHVWVKDWPRRYGDTLGTLRDFLECYPEKFTVVEGEGKRFTVELVSP